MMVGEAYRAFGLQPSPNYIAACTVLRDALIESGPYVRPTKPVGSMRDMAYRGNFVRIGKDGTKRGRLVREHYDKLQHMREASVVRPPTRAERSGYKCRADTVAALRHCVDLGSKLRGWRTNQIRILADVRKKLERENDVLRAAQPSPPNVKAVSGDVNVALLCAIVDALDWPDKMLPLNFVKGFASVGVIPDSGVYRAIEPELDEEAFNELKSSIDATNDAWVGEVCLLLKRRAAAAKPEDIEAMRVLKAKSEAEVKSGLCGAPITLAQLRRKYTRDGKLTVRVLPRFGVWQGSADARKVRAIDDARMSRTNEATLMRETIVTPSPEFPAHVLDELARICVERGIPIPDIELGLDDLFAAYRRVPTRHPEYMVAAIWDLDKAQPIFFEVFGHCFGLVSSVLNFNRVPHLLCVAAARLFAAPVDHFFDDYLTVDLASAKGSAQECLDLLHNAVRLRLEPKKRKRSAPRQVELGVDCDLQFAASRRMVLLSPTPERVADILSELTRCELAGNMSPAMAETLFGRIGFVLTTAVGAVGRAATQPLLQRAHESGGGRSLPFTPAMQHMLDFFRVLLPAIPPLSVRCGPDQADDRPPVIVYSDASYNDSEGGWSGLGIVIMDGDDRYEAGCRVPQWVLDWLRPRGQQINHLEALVLVAARLTFPDVLFGRRVLSFIDNTVALSKSVHGYANEPDMAAVVNALHVCDAALGIEAWNEWIPSHANVSDLPSREPSTWDEEACVVMAVLRARMRVQGFGQRTLLLPSVAQLDNPSVMFQAARKLAAAVADGRYFF